MAFLKRLREQSDSEENEEEEEKQEVDYNKVLQDQSNNINEEEEIGDEEENIVNTKDNENNNTDYFNSNEISNNNLSNNVNSSNANKNDNPLIQSDRLKIDDLSNENKNNQQQPISVLVINFMNGENGNLKVYKDSNPSELSYEFCKENNLDFAAMKALQSQIENVLNEYNKVLRKSMEMNSRINYNTNNKSNNICYNTNYNSNLRSNCDINDSCNKYRSKSRPLSHSSNINKSKNRYKDSTGNYSKTKTSLYINNSNSSRKYKNRNLAYCNVNCKSLSNLNYKPNIKSKDYITIQSSNNRRNNDVIFNNKLMNYGEYLYKVGEMQKERVEEKIDIIKKDIEETESEELTFHPKLFKNKSSSNVISPTALFINSNNNFINCNEESFSNNMYQKLKNLQNNKVKSTCSSCMSSQRFTKPNEDKSIHSMNVSKYINKSNNYRNDDIVNNNDEYSFHPTINKNIKINSTFQERLLKSTNNKRIYYYANSKTANSSKFINKNYRTKLINNNNNKKYINVNNNINKLSNKNLSNRNNHVGNSNVNNNNYSSNLQSDDSKNNLSKSRERIIQNYIKKNMEYNYEIDPETGQELFKPKLVSKNYSRVNKENVFQINYDYAQYYKCNKEKLSLDNDNRFKCAENIPNKTEKIFNDKKTESFKYIFKLLDGDEDGLISSISLNKKTINPKILNIISPIIIQLKQFKVTVNEDEFVEAMEVLFNSLNMNDKNIIMNIKKCSRINNKTKYK